MTFSRKSLTYKVAAAVAVVFGVLTIVSGGSVLFGGDAVRGAAGNTVGFVLWFNFLSGFVYVLAGLGIWLRRGWARPLTMILAAAIAAVCVAFGVHVAMGGAFEMRTLGALILRLGVWVAIARVLVR